MEIQTQRLVLRPLKSGDLDAIHRLWTAPGVRRYLWDDEIIPRDRTEDILQENERLFTEKSFGLWGGWSQTRERLIGFSGFWYFREPPEPEILYGIADDLWGRGYASEMAAAMVAYGFEKLNVPKIIGSTDAPNVASSRVMEKLGFQLDKRETVEGLDTLFYGLSRPSP